MEWQVMAVEPTKDFKLILTFKSGEKKFLIFFPCWNMKLINLSGISDSL